MWLTVFTRSDKNSRAPYGERRAGGTVSIRAWSQLRSVTVIDSQRILRSLLPSSLWWVDVPDSHPCSAPGSPKFPIPKYSCAPQPPSAILQHQFVSNLRPVVSKRRASFSSPRTPVSRLSKWKGRTMPEPEGPRFIREKKADGGFDSICIRCVVLVASAKRQKGTWS
jgi:hypothetical protein